MAETGVSFLLSVHDGAATYNTLASQRSTTFNRGQDEADGTTKDDSGWHVGVPTIRNWSFDAEGVLTESDTAYGDLDDAYMSGVAINCRITTPDATTYTGSCTVSALNIDGPHDDALTYTVTLTGSATLTKA